MENLFNKSICNICLSDDRKLFIIKYPVLPSNLQYISHSNTDKLVCWECKANINKMVQLTQRAMIAQRFLNDLVQNKRIKSLSTLTVSTKNTYDVVLINDTIKTEQEEYESDSSLTEGMDPSYITDDIDPSYIQVDIKPSYITSVDPSFRTDGLDSISIEYDINPSNETDDIDPGLVTHDRKDILDPVSVNNEQYSNINPYNASVVENNSVVNVSKIDEDSNIRTVGGRKRQNNGNKVCKKPVVKRESAKKEGKTIKIEIEEEEREIKSPEPVLYTIKRVTEEELLSLREKLRNSRVYMNKLHKCNSCLEDFPKQEFLKKHLIDFHSENLGPYICDICQQRYSDMAKMMEHRDSHMNLYICTQCTKHKSFNLNQILRHLDFIHSRKYTCTRCNISFTSKYAQTYHRLLHNLKECNICGKRIANMALHMTTHTGATGPKVECKICHKLLKCKASLERHLTVTHNASPNDEAYCAECDKMFKHKFIYRAHLRNSKNHNQPDKECDYCHKKFTTKVAIMKHLKVVHYKIFNYKCDLCGKGVSTKNCLRRHLATHHGGYKERNHACELCGKTFIDKPTLRNHMNVHTGERPYKCQICLATFAYESALYMHNRLKHLKWKRGMKKPENIDNIV